MMLVRLPRHPMTTRLVMKMSGAVGATLEGKRETTRKSIIRKSFGFVSFSLNLMWPYSRRFPFPCIFDECNKELGQEEFLDHVRAHYLPIRVEERKCPSPTCEFKNGKLSQILVHMKSDHKNHYFPCPAAGCGVTLPSKKYVLWHRRERCRICIFCTKKCNCANMRLRHEGRCNKVSKEDRDAYMANKTRCEL